MKLKLTLALVALAGLASSLALVGTTQASDGKNASTTTGTSTGKKGDGEHGHHGNSSCQRVELRGTNGSGSVAFTVTKANDNGSSLVGKQVTLTVPAGSVVGAMACVDTAGALTLHGLVVMPAAAPQTTTTTTTGANTTNAPHSHHHSQH